MHFNSTTAAVMIYAITIGLTLTVDILLCVCEGPPMVPSTRENKFSKPLIRRKRQGDAVNYRKHLYAVIFHGCSRNGNFPHSLSLMIQA